MILLIFQTLLFVSIALNVFAFIFIPGYPSRFAREMKASLLECAKDIREAFPPPLDRV